MALKARGCLGSEFRPLAASRSPTGPVVNGNMDHLGGGLPAIRLSEGSLLGFGASF